MADPTVELKPGWYSRPGATTAHRLRAGTGIPVTSCGRQRGTWSTAPTDMRHCVQCVRRQPARHAADTRPCGSQT